MEEKKPCHTKLCAFRCLIFGPQNLESEVSKSSSNILVENYFFLENYVTSKGDVFHNVLYCQQLSIAQVFVLTIILSNFQ